MEPGRARAGPRRADRQRDRGRRAGSSPTPTPRSCGPRASPGSTPRPSRQLIEAHGKDPRQRSCARPTDGDAGFPALLPLATSPRSRALAPTRMPGELFDDLEAAGVPFAVLETGDPGRHPRRLDRARRPPALRRPARPLRRARARVGRRRGGHPRRRAARGPGVDRVRSTLTPGMGRPNARVIGVGSSSLVAILVVAGIAWWLSPQPLLPEAEASLASDRDRHVPTTRAPGSSGRRPTPVPTTGPGRLPGREGPGRRPTARSPRRSPTSGYLVAVIPMPLNLAILGISKADGPIGAHPEITRWAIGGHSLGGSMAAQYAGGPPRPRSPGSRSGRPTRQPTCRRSTWRCCRRGARWMPAPPGCPGAEARDRGAGRMPCSSRSRAATTSRWAGTRASPTTRRRRSRARTSSDGSRSSTVELLGRVEAPTP